MWFRYLGKTFLGVVSDVFAFFLQMSLCSHRKAMLKKEQKLLSYLQTVETWSDAVFCGGIWSGSALFASYPFWRLEIKMAFNSLHVRMCQLERMLIIGLDKSGLLHDFPSW